MTATYNLLPHRRSDGASARASLQRLALLCIDNGMVIIILLVIWTAAASLQAGRHTQGDEAVTSQAKQRAASNATSY